MVVKAVLVEEEKEQEDYSNHETSHTSVQITNKYFLNDRN